jgi:hypothetical protein
MQGQGRVSWEHGIHTLRGKWSRVLEIYGDGQSRMLWSPTILRAIDRALEGSSWTAFQEEVTELRESKALALCHNDFHGGNVLWRHDDQGVSLNDVAIVDWAEVLWVLCLVKQVDQIFTIRFRPGCRVGSPCGCCPVCHQQLYSCISPGE